MAETVLTDKTKVTLGITAAAVLFVAGVVERFVTVYDRVAEHSRELDAHQKAIEELARVQAAASEKAASAQITMSMDVAVMREKLAAMSETMARMDGRLSPVTVQANGTIPAHKAR